MLSGSKGSPDTRLISLPSSETIRELVLVMAWKSFICPFSLLSPSHVGLRYCIFSDSLLELLQISALIIELSTVET